MTIERLAARTLATGFAYPEGPRWRDGHLWFSDQHAGLVHCLADDGARVDAFRVEGSPSGLGWTPEGDLLVVSMEGHRILRRAGSDLVLHADLSAFHHHQSNDMVVGADGRAWVGNIGFDFDHGEAPKPTMLLVVDPDGSVRLAAEDLLCPNGTVLTPDGGTLIVAESLAGRLTAFDVAADGTLGGRRVFAGLPDHVPDGICLDADGQVWVASPFARSVLRVHGGGEITASIAIEDAMPFACVLGGADGRDLFICCAGDHQRSRTRDLMSGRIDVARAPSPGRSP